MAVEEEPSYLDSSHQSLSNQLVSLADRIDKIFGTPRATDQVNRTTLRLSGFYDWTGRGDDNSGTEVRLNLRLPILERRGRVLTDKLKFDNQNKKPESNSILEHDPLQLTEEQEAERIMEERKRWHLRAEPGLRLNNTIAFFEKARATRTFFMGNLAHNFSQEFTWDSATLWEESTLIESDFALSDKWLFRFENRGDWQISDTRFFSHHGPELIQKLSQNSAISYSTKLMSQVRAARWFADTYKLSVNYRRSVYSNWAFLELTPALLFQKEQRFKGMTSFTARLEFLFGAI